MAQYSRLVPNQSRSTNEIHALILHYRDGVTLKKLMQDNSECLKDASSVIAAIGLLEEEGKVRVERSTGHHDYRDSLTVYPLK